MIFFINAYTNIYIRKKRNIYYNIEFIEIPRIFINKYVLIPCRSRKFILPTWRFIVLGSILLKKITS